MGCKHAAVILFTVLMALLHSVDAQHSVQAVITNACSETIKVTFSRDATYTGMNNSGNFFGAAAIFKNTAAADDDLAGCCSFWTTYRAKV